MGVHLIGGDEPYLVDCQRISLVGRLEAPEMNYMEFDTLEEDVFTFLSTFPFMDTRKVAYVTVQDVAECDVPSFHSLLDECPDYATLVVRFRNYDGRKNFFKQMKKCHCLSLYDKDQAIPGLPAFVEKRATKLGAVFAPGALDEFLRRENYIERDDINLYNILEDLKNLVSLEKNISVENVVSLISENNKDNVFAIASLIRNCDIVGLRKQASLLRGMEIPTLSALLREYRLAYKAQYYSASEIEIGRAHV